MIHVTTEAPGGLVNPRREVGALGTALGQRSPSDPRTQLIHLVAGHHQDETRRTTV